MDWEFIFVGDEELKLAYSELLNHFSNTDYQQESTKRKP
jgi:hypothetical protein